MAQSKVLLIYTGGTIGMIADSATGTLKAFDFDHLHTQIPELARIDVELDAISMLPIDSSDMTPGKWQEIAIIIAENYHSHDGFVVLHGSDTMAYTASALSYMLQGLAKPVILTGSQLPIGTIRTDGKENLITAIEIAAQKDASGLSMVREVAIYFEYSLYRGNRTTKVSANSFEAFKSPNYPVLAIAGVNIEFNSTALHTPQSKEMKVVTKMDDQVALVKLFPGFNPDVYSQLFDVKDVKGIVLETFGSGNAPNNLRFIAMLSNFIEAGGVVLNVTQCYSGEVSQGKYENSAFFNAIGVVSGRDLTTEAAITKMMFVLGNFEKREDIEWYLGNSMAGEMTV
jgi:L-asparaginase